MDKLLRAHADKIVAASIKAVQPDEAVSRALAGQEFTGRVLPVPPFPIPVPANRRSPSPESII